MTVFRLPGNRIILWLRAWNCRSHAMRKPVFGDGLNQPVQLQKRTIVLEFWILRHRYYNCPGSKQQRLWWLKWAGSSATLLLAWHKLIFSWHASFYCLPKSSGVSDVKPDVGQWKATWRQISASISQDIPSQLFHVIQSDVALYSHVHGIGLSSWLV